MSADKQVAKRLPDSSPRQFPERRQAGELPPPEFVIVGVPVDANRKRIYASLRIPKAKFGIEQVNFQPTWMLSTAMPDMIIITRDTYADALDELMRIWAARQGTGLPKLGITADPAERRLARRRALEAAGPNDYLHPDQRRELEQIREIDATRRRITAAAEAQGATVEHVEDMTIITLPDKLDLSGPDPIVETTYPVGAARPEYRTRSGKILTDSDLDALAAEAERGYRVRCPDDGKCHHGCLLDQACFRVLFAGPLSAAGYPGDTWPKEIADEHRELNRQAGTGDL